VSATSCTGRRWRPPRDPTPGFNLATLAIAIEHNLAHTTVPSPTREAAILIPTWPSLVEARARCGDAVASEPDNDVVT
jgi:hypothetical protein